MKSSIESLTNVFVGTTSKTIQNIIKAKVEDLEGQIGAIEGKIVYLENKKADKDKYIRELNNKIASLKRENQEVPSKELSRVEWLDKVEKIIVGGKNDLVEMYKINWYQFGLFMYFWYNMVMSCGGILWRINI